MWNFMRLIISNIHAFCVSSRCALYCFLPKPFGSTPPYRPIRLWSPCMMIQKAKHAETRARRIKMRKCCLWWWDDDDPCTAILNHNHHSLLPCLATYSLARYKQLDQNDWSVSHVSVSPSLWNHHLTMSSQHCERITIKVPMAIAKYNQMLIHRAAFFDTACLYIDIFNF